MYFFGSQFVLVLIGSLYGMFFVQFIMVPILYPLDIVSINEYITLRFGSQGLRKLSSVILLINTMVYNGVCLYAPSLTLSTVTGLSTHYSITIMGLICSFYITIVSMIAIVRRFDPSPYVRYTFWSVQVQGLYNMISWLGISQMGYMRLSSVPSLGKAKRLCCYHFLGLCGLWLTFFFSGIVAYATYSDCDPLTSGRIDEPDQILPYLVVQKISHVPGMAGLFVAAVYSGMLSSVSTYANSAASLIWQDLLSEMEFFKGYSDIMATRMLKILSAVIGVSAIGFAMLVKQLGSIISVTNSFLNALGGSMKGIFIAGMFAPWVNTKSVPPSPLSCPRLICSMALLQGAYAGFITTLSFNMWLLIGQFSVGHRQPEMLPLSTEGCPESVYHLNSTLVLSLDSPTENLTYSVKMSEGEPHEEQMEKSIYDLSYCYTGVIGIAVFYIVASLISVLTASSPCDQSEFSALVDPPLVNHPPDVYSRPVKHVFIHSLLEQLSESRNVRRNSTFTTEHLYMALGHLMYQLHADAKLTLRASAGNDSTPPMCWTCPLPIGGDKRRNQTEVRSHTCGPHPSQHHLKMTKATRTQENDELKFYMEAGKELDLTGQATRDWVQERLHSAKEEREKVRIAQEK
ncbi:sodium-coupled monocarboxylate transporter 2-like [Macrobrachium rosenbergii]|uniref:sodium-coupled monocarboxylate transporter 2-like n=1 Tax=Macrobrachium rosenbergii TaxID=79674 RepID=UPI0034D60DEF